MDFSKNSLKMRLHNIWSFIVPITEFIDIPVVAEISDLPAGCSGYLPFLAYLTPPRPRNLIPEMPIPTPLPPHTHIHTYSPADRMTHTCENVAFPTTSLAGGNSKCFGAQVVCRLIYQPSRTYNLFTSDSHSTLNV